MQAWRPRLSFEPIKNRGFERRHIQLILVTVFIAVVLIVISLGPLESLLQRFAPDAAGVWTLPAEKLSSYMGNIRSKAADRLPALRSFIGDTDRNPGET